MVLKPDTEEKKKEEVKESFYYVEEEEKSVDKAPEKEGRTLKEILKATKLPELNKRKNKDELFYHVIKPSVMQFLVPAFVGMIYAIEMF